MFCLCFPPKSFIVSILIFQRRQWHPTPGLLPGKSHGWRSLVGCSPWGHEELDMTELLHFHFSLSCIGEGNGNPLQCSCLENPRDGEAWRAAVYGVAQSRTRLKQLSSSRNSYLLLSVFLVYFRYNGLLGVPGTSQHALASGPLHMMNTALCPHWGMFYRRHLRG